MDQDGTSQNFGSSSPRYLQEELQAKNVLLDTVHLENESLKTKNNQLELLLGKKEQKISQYAEKLFEYKAALQNRDDVVTLLQQNLTSSLTQLEQQREGTGNTALHLQEEVNGLTHQLQQALQLLSERDDCGNSWRLQHFRLQQQVEKLTKENEDVCLKLLHAEKTLLTLRDERKKDESKCSEARKQLQTVTYEWSAKERSFSEKSKKLESRIVNLEQNLVAEKHVREEASRQLDEMRGEKQVAESVAQKHLVGKQEEIIALTKKCEELQNCIAGLESKNVAYNNQLMELHNSLTSSSDALEKSQSEVSGFTLKTEAYINEIKTLNTTILKLNADIAQKNEVQCEILAKIQSDDDEFIALRKQIFELTNEIQENDGKYEELIRKCYGLEEELSNCQSNISDLNRELLSKEAEKHSMSLELKNLTTENVNMSSQLLLLEQDMQRFREQVLGLEVQRDVLRKREEQLMENIDRLGGEAATSEANVQELDLCIQEKDGQIVTLEEEKEELNGLLHKQAQLIVTLKGDKKQLNEQKHGHAEQFVSEENDEGELNNRRMLEQAAEIVLITDDEKMKCSVEEQRPAEKLREGASSRPHLEVHTDQSSPRGRDEAPSGPHHEEDTDQSGAEELFNELKQLRTRVSNLNFVIKSLENENSNLKRHKKENKLLNESVNETLLRNAELLTELENMTLKYKQAEIRLKALDSEVELLNTCVKELQKLSSSCVPDGAGESSAGDCSEEAWRLSQELALNISQQRLQEHEQTMILIKSSHEQSRTAQLTLRDELREAVYTNMALHAHSLATHEMCFMNLLACALDDQSVGLCLPEEDGSPEAETTGMGTDPSGLYRWQGAVAAALDRAKVAHKDVRLPCGTSEADAILDGQRRIERLLEEAPDDSASLGACAMQGIQWGYHLLLRAALVRCGVLWPLDGSLQSAVTEALQWAVLPTPPHHEQDCLRYAGLCKALCAAQGAGEEEEEEGLRSLRGQLRDLQRDVQGSVERGVAAVLDTVRGLLQVVGDPVDTELANSLNSSPHTDGENEDGLLVSAAAPTSQFLLDAVQTKDTEHDTLSQSSTLTQHTSPAQPDHLQNLLGNREVHQTVIVQLTEACAQLLHYYCVSEAYNRGHSAATAPSPDTSHDASNIDGFIDDTLWSSGSMQPRSLDTAPDAKLSTINALVEKYEQERPPGASCADHSCGRASFWDGGLAHGSQQDDVEERRVRNGLLTSYPHMMACLSGQWEDVDLHGLDKDVQEITISLQASAGMLKVMYHSKQYGHVEQSEMPSTSDGVEGRGDVIPSVAADDRVCDEGKGSIPISERVAGGQSLLSNIREGSGVSSPDTVATTGAKSTETENTETRALDIPASDGKELHLNCTAETNDLDKICSSLVPHPGSMLSETNDVTSKSSPSKSGSNGVCQATPSGQQLAQDADMTRLNPSKAPHDDQQTEEEKLLKLTADIQEVKSENHRLHGLCLGLQAEKKKLQEELESLEKYSSFITRELQTVQQADGSEAPRSSDGEEYSSCGAELGAASALAQHARSLLLLRGQSSSAARVGELEAVLEALLREQHEQRKALAAQAQDLTTQLECADRQLRASRQFVEELTHEREAEVEQFVQSNSRLTEQLREHAAAAEHTERLCAEVEALESELVRQTRHVEALTGEASTAKEALKDANAKIQELCAVLSNRDDSEAVSATRQSEAQVQLTALREQLTHAHHQLQQHQEQLQVTSGEGGQASPHRSPCPHCSGTTKRAAATVESPRNTALRRHSLKEEMLQHDTTPSKAGDLLDNTLAEEMNKSTICKVEQRVMRLTKNLEALQFTGQRHSIDQRSGDVDDGVSSDEEDWSGYGGGADSSLRSLSPGALDRRLEERLVGMERVTQAAVKHTADLEMMLALTRTNLQEVMDDKDKAQQHLDEVTQKIDVLQKQYSSDLVLLEELRTHNNDLQNQCQSQQETVRSLKKEVEYRSNDCKVLSKERETLLQRLSGFEEEVSKLLKKVCALEVANAEAACTQEVEGRLAEEADQNTKAEMMSILHQLDVKTRQLESNCKQLDEKSREFESKNQEFEDKCGELQVVAQELEDVRRELKATRDRLDESKREVHERTQELDEVRGEREYLQGSLSEQLVKVAGLQARLEEQKRVGGCGPSVAEMEARVLALRTALDRATNDITHKDRQLADFKYNFSEQRTLLVQREAELERLLQRPRPVSPRLKHAASQTVTGADDATFDSTRRQLDELNLQLEAKKRHLQDVMAEEGNTSDPEILRRASVASSVMLHPHWSAAKSVCSSSTSELSHASTPRPNSPRLTLDSPPQVGEVQRKQLQHQTEDEILQETHAQRQLEKKIALLHEREEQQQREYKQVKTSYELLKKQLKTALDQHEVSVGALQRQCAESAASLSELRDRSSNLQESLQTSRESEQKLLSSNNKLQKELANSRERLEAVSKELTAVMQRISDVQQQNEHHKEVIEEQSKQLMDGTSVLADTNAQLQTARQQLQDERNKGLLLQQERDQMQQEVHTARKQLLVEQGKAQAKAQQENAHNGLHREQMSASQHASAEAREVSALQERVDRRAASLQQLERRLGTADASVRKLEQQLQDRQAAVEQLTAQLAVSGEQRQQLQNSVKLLRSQLSQLEQRSCSPNDPPLDARAALSDCHRHTLSTSSSPAAENFTAGICQSQLSGGDSILDVTNLTPEEASRMAARLADRVQREGAQVLELTEFLFLKDTAFSKAQDAPSQQRLGASASLQQQHRVSALQLCLKQQLELSQCRQDGQEMQALENRLQHERLTRLRLEGQLSAATTRNGRLELQLRDLAATVDQLRCTHEETECQLERIKYELSEERSNFSQVSDDLRRATQHSFAQHRRYNAATKELERCLQEERLTKAALLEEVSQLRTKSDTSRPPTSACDLIPALLSDVIPSHVDCEELQLLTRQSSAASTECRLWRAAEASLVSQPVTDERRQTLLANKQLTEALARLAQEKELLLLQKSRAEQHCGELEQRCDEFQQQCGRLEQTLRKQMTLQGESVTQTDHSRLSPPPSTAPPTEMLRKEVQALTQRNADLQHDRSFYQQQCNRLQQELCQRPVAPSLGWPATAQLLPVVTTEELQQRLQHTFARYLRAQSHKKSLVWQKSYLLKALSQDSNASPRLRALLHPTMIDGPSTHLSLAPPLVRFRSVCHVMRAVWRLQHRVRHMALNSRIPSAACLSVPQLAALDAAGAVLRDSVSCTSLEVCGYTAGVASLGLASPPAAVSPGAAAVVASIAASPPSPCHNIQLPTATYLGRPAPTIPHWPRPLESLASGVAGGDGVQHWTLQSPPTRDQPLHVNKDRSSQKSKKSGCQDYVERADALHDTLGLLRRPGH